MKVVRLKIENFRSIKSAELHFDGHALIVGPNNVGKSTICEALDLVLVGERSTHQAKHVGLVYRHVVRLARRRL